MSDVLIIDDDDVSCRLLSRTLASHGLGRCDTAATATAARAAIQARAYDLVFLDLNLPEPVGEILLREILSLRPTQAVVVVTGLNEVDVAVRCLQLGARDFLTKPCSPVRLLAAVARARRSFQAVIGGVGDAFPSIDAVTDAVIQAALERTQGNLTQAAQLIGMSRSGLAKRLAKRGG